MKAFIHAFLLCLLLSDLAFAEIGTIDNVAKTRTVQGTDGNTYVEFYTIIAGGMVTIPLTNPLGRAHYPASVKLYRKDGDNLIFVADRYGDWIDNGCFEMDVSIPYEMVRIK